MRQGTGTNRPKTYTQTRDHTHPRMPNKHSHPTTNNTSPNHQKGGTPTECTKLRRLIAAGKRPDPSRTRKLSLPAPMILPNPGGKVGHRRTQIRITPHNCVGGDSIWPQLISNSQFWPHRVERHTWSRTDGAVATSAVQDA